MRPRMLWPLAQLVAPLFIAPLAGAQSGRSGDSASLSGTILSGTVARPIVGASVEVVGVTTVRSDSVGAFRFSVVPVGTLMLRTTMIGFRPSLKMISIRAGEEMHLTITLDATAQELARVTVREDSSRSVSLLSDPTGFDARRRNATGGLYIVAADIEKKHLLATEQLFHGVPSMYVDTGGIVVVNRGVNSTRDITKGGDQFYHCIGAQVLVDGVAMPQPFDINQVALDRIRAIEVYRGAATTPAALRSIKTTCGTVAIWTK
jgi:hypothetical protein